MQIIEKSYVPVINPNFVPFGDYEDVEKVFLNRSNKLNVLVSGPKGCGKTQMIENIHAKNGLPLMRVNVTIESDEDSLMGGLRLVDGNTAFDKGPVLRAMEMGATLLLDEIDLGHPTKLMCLQSVLEHSGYLIKKTGEMVYPKEGFKIIMTANTKGRGDETGQYIGTQILNGAMLDRVSIFFDWYYPDQTTETKILNKLAESISISCENENRKLVAWADGVRAGGVENVDSDETISTRKLCDIVSAFSIYGDLKKAVARSIGGMDKSTVDGLLLFLDTVDPDNTNTPSKQKQTKTYTWNMD